MTVEEQVQEKTKAASVALGKVFQQLREKQQLNYNQLADKSEGAVSNTAISSMEKGNPSPTLQTIVAIADALGYNVRIGLTEKPKVQKLETIPVI